MGRDSERLVLVRASLLAALRDEEVPAGSPFPRASELEYDASLEWAEDHVISGNRQFREGLNLALEDVHPDDWRAACQVEASPGLYSVVVGWARSSDDPVIWEMQSGAAALVISCVAGILPDASDELVKRIANIGPEAVLVGISLNAATVAKQELLTSTGVLTAEIKDSSGPTRVGRESIPAQARREVWRRDEGKCVDCGSRDRLEYDHIIPLSKGGSNTVRNIELRCESCNRRKAATI